MDDEGLLQHYTSSTVTRQLKNDVSVSAFNTLSTASSIYQAQVDAIESEEVQSMSSDTKPVYCITLRPDLGVFDDIFPKSFSPGYIVCLRFVDVLPQDRILNYLLSMGLCIETLEQLYEINSTFLQGACTEPHQQADVFFNDQDIRYMDRTTWMSATGEERKVVRAHFGDCQAL